MNRIRSFLVLLVVSTAAIAVERAASAEESGSFSAISSLDFDYATIEFAGERVTAGAMNGTTTILDSTGGSFTPGGSSVARCVVYTRVSAAGVDVESTCKTRNSSGDELYFRGKRTAGDLGGGDGRLQIIGGTGGYADVTGSCEYDTEYLTDRRAVTKMDCEWTKP